MQPYRPITLALTTLLAMNLVSAEIDRPRGGLKLSSLTITQAQAKPGYLNEGEPFALRKAPQLRPPAYALPALPIAPDPQPLPLAASTPAQPLNPAQGGGRPPAPGITIPAMRVAPIQPFTIEAQPTFVAPGQMIQSGAPAGINVSGLRQATPQNAFLNPEILQYFNADANGTYRSRIRLDANSLFTLPSMNPLLQRSGSTTYQIK